MLGNRAVQTFWGQLSGALSDGIAPWSDRLAPSVIPVPIFTNDPVLSSAFILSVN